MFIYNYYCPECGSSHIATDGTFTWSNFQRRWIGDIVNNPSEDKYRYLWCLDCNWNTDSSGEEVEKKLVKITNIKLL